MAHIEKTEVQGYTSTKTRMQRQHHECSSCCLQCPASHEQQLQVDLEIRRERIRLIYEEAKALRELKDAQEGTRKTRRRLKLLDSETEEEYGNDNDDEMVVPGTDYSSSSSDEYGDIRQEQKPSMKNNQKLQILVPETDDDDTSSDDSSSISYDQAYSALLQCIPSEDERERLLLAKECANALEEAEASSDGGAEAVRRVKVQFLSRCQKKARMIAHLDDVCMPGFREDLEAIRMHKYEAQLENRLKKCIETANSHVQHKSPSAIRRARKGVFCTHERMGHYCTLVLLKLTCCFMSREAEGALIDAAGSNVFEMRIKAHNIKVMREALLDEAENALLDKEESTLTAAARAAAIRVEEQSKYVYHAKSRLRRAEWKLNAFNASTLLRVAQVLVLDDHVQKLFAQRFGLV